MKLEQKVVIITGAARGIGRCYASAFGKEGAKIVVADVDFENANIVAETLKKDGVEAVSVKTDVSNPKSTKDMAEKAMENQKNKLGIGIFRRCAIYPSMQFRYEKI